MITLNYRGELSALTGTPSEVIDAETIVEVLTFIRKTHGRAAYKEAKRMLITVNNTSILISSGFKTPLTDGDTVAFLPICGGG